MFDLIEALVNENLVTHEQVKDAQEKQLGAKKPLTDVLIDMGFVKEEDLIRVSARVFKMPVVNLSEMEIDPAFIKLIPSELAKRYGIFPLHKDKDSADNEVLLLATSDPQDIVAQDHIKVLVGMDVKPVLATRGDISGHIEKHYQLDDMLYDILKNLEQDSSLRAVSGGKSDSRVADVEKLGSDNSPIVSLVNFILSDAVRTRASDIHIEPRETYVAVRYRIFGDLKNIINVPSNLYLHLSARVKVLAGVDIAESRKPQDGRTSIMVSGRKIDLRVSTVPTYYGETIVLRLLDAEGSKLDLSKTGFGEDELAIFKDAIFKPQGMILVTGPTGSGKTSTLYAALNHIKSETKNIITVEDPVEYVIEGLNQIQVNPVKEVTFANALRSILRQDPNVILVGEIRDTETAEIAFRASMTGHLVLSTVHTNNSIATIARLFDMGLEPYLVSSSILLIIAQRLVRLNCPNCKVEYTPEERLLHKFKIYIEQFGIKQFYKGKGCRKCDFSGFQGRAAIFELLKISEKMRSLIARSAPEDEFLKEAIACGIKFLAESGMEKVAGGFTSLEEVAKVADVVEQSPSAKQAAPRDKSKIKVLIADDEADILASMERRLTMLGYAVVKAANGSDAVERAFQEKPDLILMDLSMPGMDGLEAIKALRSKLETAAIPVIMLTAVTAKESELTAFDVGADDYLTKPFDFDKLHARMKMLLKRKWKWTASE